MISQPARAFVLNTVTKTLAFRTNALAAVFANLSHITTHSKQTIYS